MNHWAFITAAYAATVVPVGALVIWAYASMRRAETAADKLRK